MNVTDEDMKEALDRIARTEDGYRLYLYFQRILCEILSPPFEDGALPAHNGRRKFAAELMNLMREGIEASGGRYGNDPVIFARRQPADTGSRRQSIRDYLAGEPNVWQPDPADAANGRTS